MEMTSSRITFRCIAIVALLLGVLPGSLCGRIAAQATAAPQQPSAQAPAQAEATSTLTVQITGIRNAKGWISVVLYKDGIGFPTHHEDAVATKHVQVDAKTLTATAVFEKLPQGVYAAAVLHDEKMIGTMEYDAQGIPQEGYGISNNPDSSQGPPSAEEAEFHVDKPECSIAIKLVYWQ